MAMGLPFMRLKWAFTLQRMVPGHCKKGSPRLTVQHSMDDMTENSRSEHTRFAIKGARPLPRTLDRLLRFGLLLPFWRATRGMTLGVRAVVLDPENRVLLVRHGYTTGAHFPGGGVDRGESVEMALHRELEEEARIKAVAPATFHGVFTNFKALPGDHVFVYVIRAFESTGTLIPNNEITSAEFYALGNLPEDISPGTARRLDEIVGGIVPSSEW